MKIQYNFLSVLSIATLLLGGCSQNKNTELTSSMEVNSVNQSIKEQSNQAKKGDHVPNSHVCMVNDAYMGKKQMEVPLNGKIYYGCCEMCKKRIPQEESVRYAIDPQTLKRVDKANAYIVLISDSGEVAYFENEQNYIAFKNEKL